MIGGAALGMMGEMLFCASIGVTLVGWRKSLAHGLIVVPLASLASGPGATLPACSAARLAA